MNRQNSWRSNQGPTAVDPRQFVRATIKLKQSSIFQAIDLFIAAIVIPVSNRYELAGVCDECANLYRVRVIRNRATGDLLFPTISIPASESGRCVNSQPARMALTVPSFMAQDSGCQESSVSTSPLAASNAAIATILLMSFNT